MTTLEFLEKMHSRDLTHQERWNIIGFIAGFAKTHGELNGVDPLLMAFAMIEANRQHSANVANVRNN